MRIGINFSNTTMLDSIEPVLDSARQCDADGFAHWWLPQAGYLDALTVFAAAAPLAPRIEMGTAVIPTWLYPPHTLAAKAYNNSRTWLRRERPISRRSKSVRIPKKSSGPAPC